MRMRIDRNDTRVEAKIGDGLAREPRGYPRTDLDIAPRAVLRDQPVERGAIKGREPGVVPQRRERVRRITRNAPERFDVPRDAREGLRDLRPRPFERGDDRAARSGLRQRALVGMVRVVGID
jgi:hypothetical protein